MRVHFSTAENQSMQARSKLPHQVNSQYGGGMFERHCYNQAYHMYKNVWEAAKESATNYLECCRLFYLLYLPYSHYTLVPFSYSTLATFLLARAIA